MAVVLQPTMSNTFNSTPDPLSCRLERPFSFPDPSSEPDTVSLNTAIQNKSHQPSPASISSLMSTPTYYDDENVSPVSRPKRRSLEFRSASTRSRLNTPDKFNRFQSKSRNFTFQPLLQTLNVLKSGGEKLSFTEEDECKKDKSTTQPASIIGPEIPHEPSVPQSISNSALTQSQSATWEQTEVKVKSLSRNHNDVGTPKTDTSSQDCRVRPELTDRFYASIKHSSIHRQPSIHQQKLSDSSSGFVHSMKTASVTNLSFSVFHRSSRMGTSTDSYMLHGSQTRHSIDSDRPLSSSSSEDHVLRRAFRRQQIIDELIVTEESYVADLKALVYLYSTLLASASSIPNRLRAAIEGNVGSILYSHETLVGKLHNARLQTAARRWADTAFPARLIHSRRPESRYSEPKSQTRPGKGHRQTRSAGTSESHSYAFMPFRYAEPVDVYEITLILKENVTNFWAYEEYCANFESIRNELQKLMPQLWPTYESGMESLARAVMTIDQRKTLDHRGITVGDLLIKPIQRLTKYPLLLEQLLYNTPVADAPGTHAELDTVLQSMRDAIRMVNLAKDSDEMRVQIQRRWLLHDRLNMTLLHITSEQFRSLRQIELCGILYVTYQTAAAISGVYALCTLIDEYFLVAFPVGNTGRFDAVALIRIADIRIETPVDGKGLQCASSFFTWKISFACVGYYHELILSACSKVEEDRWIAALQGEFGQLNHCSRNSAARITTHVALNLKSAGVVFSSQRSLSRESSIQRAATVGGRPSISQVIIRNTHNISDLNEYRDSTSSNISINRSQSHMNSKRIPVLEPKRSVRSRLESSISDIWTRERLPFPGMVGSRGGQIIRASAGTLARKLSLASIQAPFSIGRTSSMSMSSRRSYDVVDENRLTFEIRRKEPMHHLKSRIKPNEIPEVDDMRSVVVRMIGSGAPTPSAGEVVVNRIRSRRGRKSSMKEVGPSDPAAIFYEQASNTGCDITSKCDDGTTAEAISIVGASGPTRRKSRWRKPISKFREFTSEAKSMLYSSSSGA